jgi:hypothetical protein
MSLLQVVLSALVAVASARPGIVGSAVGAYSAPALASVAAPALAAYAAPAVASVAAPALAAYAAPVATAITKTVQYASTPVVTGYTSQVRSCPHPAAETIGSVQYLKG